MDMRSLLLRDNHGENARQMAYRDREWSPQPHAKPRLGPAREDRDRYPRRYREDVLF